MPTSPIEVFGQWMQNLLDPDVVYSVVPRTPPTSRSTPRTPS